MYGVQLLYGVDGASRISDHRDRFLSESAVLIILNENK